MTPVKVNIFISYTPEDKKQLDKLLSWLYPMRDEVNLWYNNPPQKPPELPLPWQILLFWYAPPDFRYQYQKILEARRSKAHIYLFLTSYRSLISKQVEADIDVAAHRRIDGDDQLGPFIYPVILSPSRWRETSRLAGFKPLARGIPLSSFKQEDEGYLTVTDEIASRIKVLQSRLGELKYYQSRTPEQVTSHLAGVQKPLPYLGESDEALEFQEISTFQPPEWLGWSLLFFIFISVISYLMPARVLGPLRYENVKSDNDHGWEYLRENPLMPPKDSLKFPPAD